jgi:hypothetical protein
MAKRLRVTSVTEVNPDTGERVGFEGVGDIPGGEGRLFVRNPYPEKKPVTGDLAKKAFARLKGIEQQQLSEGVFTKEHQSVTGKPPAFSGGSRGSR